MRKFLTQTEFKEKMATTVLPYLVMHRTEKIVQGQDNTALYTCHYAAKDARGTVVLVHGFSENAEKYHEFIYYLLEEHLSVLIFDQRGHGRSARTAPIGIAHVDRFSDYIADLEAVLAAYSNLLTAPLYLFAHSMGGAVAMLFLKKHPHMFKKAVLSAPMIDLQYRGITRLACRAACRFCTLTGRGKKAIFISKKSNKNDSFEHSSALSLARYTYLREQRHSDPLLSGGAPSYAWSAAALGVRDGILARHVPERISLPVLILSAEHEYLVNNAAQEALAARLPHGSLHRVAGSKHEILFTNDEILHPVLGEILDFLQ